MTSCGGKTWRGNYVSSVSSLTVWQAIRPRAIIRCGMVLQKYLPSCVSYMASNGWSVQDKLRVWDVDATTSIGDLRCPLCKLTQDNYAHFFECTYWLQVWHKVKALMSINSTIGDSWRSLVTAIQPFAHKNLASVVVAKILGIRCTTYGKRGTICFSRRRLGRIKLEVNDSKTHRVGIRGSDEERMKVRD